MLATDELGRHRYPRADNLVVDLTAFGACVLGVVAKRPTGQGSGPVVSMGWVRQRIPSPRAASWPTSCGIWVTDRPSGSSFQTTITSPSWVC
jgi:hypothetical protein